VAIEQRIESFQSLKGLDTKAIATTLASVQGFRIIIGRKNLDECIISMDFGSSPVYFLPAAKDFFVEMMSRNSSTVLEASKWVASMDGNTIAFRGTVSVETIDQLLGVYTIQRQAANIATAGLEPLEDTTSESVKLEATKNYFAKSTNLINRVQDYSAKNTGERAQWNGHMARRIDELPTLNVDPDLVNFGVKVAEGLRGNMVALQETNIKVGAAAAVDGAGGPQVGYSSGYNGYGGYGGYYYNDSNSPYKYNAVAQAQGNYSYKELIAAIDTLEAEVRRKMTDKYKVQF